MVFVINRRKMKRFRSRPETLNNLRSQRSNGFLECVNLATYFQDFATIIIRNECIITSICFFQ